jgi:nucleotide-binding universal stress UspA family protein
MAKIKKILAPADLSQLCVSGVRLALELAQWQQAEVLIYNVLTVEESPFPQGAEDWVVKQTELPKFKKTLDQRRKQLERFFTDNFPEAASAGNVRQEVGVGTPYKRIVEKAQQEGIDMIVMSTHGRTGLAHMLIGSVTERVLRRAPCPIIAVPTPRKPRRPSIRSRLMRRSTD